MVEVLTFEKYPGSACVFAEPGRLATALRLDGAVSFTLPRPNTLMVIPEMRVLFDAGTVADLSRRLIVPLLAPEPD